MLKGFKVISVYGNSSESTVTLTPKYFRFNAETVNELGDPHYIQMLIDAEGKRFAIQACKKDDENAIPFEAPVTKGGKKWAINISFKPAHATILTMMQWNDAVSHKMTGVYVAEEKAIIYDLNRAVEVGGKKSADEE